MIVELSDRAISDLDRLDHWLRDRGAASAALEAKDLLRQALLSLEDMPERGRASPYQDRKELVVPFGRAGYLIQYRIFPDRVVVARIRHSRERR